MSISGIGMSDHSASWRKRKAQTNISGTNFAFHMADAQEPDLPLETERYKIEDASYIEGVAAYAITNKETESLNRRGQRGLLSNEANASGVQETNTRSEIIVRPDGSRVLMITVEIGGMQTAMSLKISEPTDMQNDISKQKDSRSEAPVNAAALTSNVISGSVGEE